MKRKKKNGVCPNVGKLFKNKLIQHRRCTVPDEKRWTLKECISALIRTGTLLLAVHNGYVMGFSPAQYSRCMHAYMSIDDMGRGRVLRCNSPAGQNLRLMVGSVHMQLGMMYRRGGAALRDASHFGAGGSPERPTWAHPAPGLHGAIGEDRPSVYSQLGLHPQSMREPNGTERN